MKKIIDIDLGLSEYKKTWDFQENLFNKNIKSKLDNKKPENHLILCEHPHVFTLGKSGQLNNLLANEELLRKINATFYKINRGGDITYHGPGQIVGYPVFDLEQFDMGVKKYINTIETIIIDIISKFGILGQHHSTAAGVWLDVGTERERKICAIGVKISRGITMHGFALNVNTDLKYFDYINPCGYTDKGVSSIEKETGKFQDIKKIKNLIFTKFTQYFV